MFHFGVDYYPEHWPEERWAHRRADDGGGGLQRRAPGRICLGQDGACGRSLRLCLAGSRHFDTGRAGYQGRAGHAHGLAAGLADVGLPRPLAGARGRRGLDLRQPPRVLPEQRNLPRLLARASSRPWPSTMPATRAVIGWQIDNEFGDRCYCPACRHAFHDLAARSLPDARHAQ